MNHALKVFLTTAFAVSLAIAPGCAKTAPAPELADAGATEQSTAATAETSHDDHSGWWCNEHGVPENICGQCNSKLAAEFQRKGDWCQDHDRPDSQCFACHPQLEAAFAARYEAKMGAKPPKPQG